MSHLQTDFDYKWNSANKFFIQVKKFICKVKVFLKAF